jgi:hypothetical protein
MNNKDIKMIYDSMSFDLPEMILSNYTDDYFKLELDLESDIFYDLRVSNNISPNRINESSEIELSRIKQYFNTHKNDFYFYFIKDDLIGSSMHIENQINCLSIARKYQKMGYGSLLTKFMVNKIYQKEANCFIPSYNSGYTLRCTSIPFRCILGTQ